MARETSFTRKIRSGDEDIEVEVSAVVRLGDGGPDPSEIDNLSVKCLASGSNITDDLPPDLLDQLIQELFDCAYDNLGDD